MRPSWTQPFASGFTPMLVLACFLIWIMLSLFPPRSVAKDTAISFARSRHQRVWYVLRSALLRPTSQAATRPVDTESRSPIPPNAREVSGLGPRRSNIQGVLRVCPPARARQTLLAVVLLAARRQGGPFFSPLGS